MVSGGIKMLAVAALVPLVMGACSEDAEPGGGTTPPTESSEPSEEPAEATVAVEDSDFGQIVVDAAEGRTLYVFLADTGSDSTCYDECEDSWPPLTVEGDPAAGEGIDASLLGTTRIRSAGASLTLVSGALQRGRVS